MTIEIRQMGEDDAREIAAWRYDPPYSFYDADADADDLALLLDEEVRQGRYFSAFSAHALVGEHRVCAVSARGGNPLPRRTASGRSGAAQDRRPSSRLEFDRRHLREAEQAACP